MNKKTYIEPKATVVALESRAIIAASATLKRGNPQPPTQDEELKSDPYGRICAE